jgi:hypothetical protein
MVALRDLLASDRVTYRRVLPHPHQGVFSSFVLADLEDVDGHGELPGLPRAAAEFPQDAPGLELGAGVLARAA